MNGLPYYKRYPRDFIHGTANLPFELKVTYAYLLDLIYLHSGRLPDSPRYISGLLGVSLRKWSALREGLVAADKVIVSGEFLTNYRADKEIEILAKLSYKQSENASKPRKNKGLQQPWQRHTESDTESDKKDAIASPKKSMSSEIREAFAGLIPDDLAEDFIRHRQVLRKTLTPRAAKMIAAKLAEMPNPAASVEQSILKGWQDVFPPKGGGQPSGPAIGDRKTSNGRTVEYGGAVDGWMEVRQ